MPLSAVHKKDESVEMPSGVKEFGPDRKPKLHVRIMEAFSHLAHHYHSGSNESEDHNILTVPDIGSLDLSSPSNDSHGAFKQPASSSPNESNKSNSAQLTSPIAIPLPRKHRSSFWGLFGRKLEREEIPVSTSVESHPSPISRSPARSVIKIDDEALKLIQEIVPEVVDPTDVVFSSKYRFVNSKVIGKGASGVVRLACRKDANEAAHDNILAVKEFRRRKRDETQHEYLRKITAEYCIATSMHHANVVETMDFVQDRERWYEVMEYCPGGDLFLALSHGQMDDEQIDSCFKELVEGVYYLHSLGVAHRDLKPENILIDSKGHCRITDFGVSDVFKVCWERAPHKSRGVCGSSPYIAPEEFNGEEYDAQKVDVWSLGIIYYALIFHSVPWEEARLSDPHFAAYLKKGQELFEPFQRLPRHARTLLKKMLEVDPNKRFSIDQVRNDLWIQRIPFVPLPVKTLNGSLQS